MRRLRGSTFVWLVTGIAAAILPASPIRGGACPEPTASETPAAEPCGESIALGIDCLNDSIGTPAAFGLQEITVAPRRLAAFQVFKLSPNPACYANVTAEYRHRTRPGQPPAGRLSVRVIPAPGTRSVPGKLWYTSASDIPRIYFGPNHPAARDRSVYVIFSYLTSSTPPRVLSSVFTVHFQGTRSAHATATAHASRPDLAAGPETASPGRSRAQCVEAPEGTAEHGHLHG